VTPETKEMLENAARAAIAAGLPVQWDDTYGWMQGIGSMWRPDIIQGDSDRMGIALDIAIRIQTGLSKVRAEHLYLHGGHWHRWREYVEYTEDRCADVRLARLMVADQIGRAMK